MASESKYPLQISEGYRGARRYTSVLCALGLAWSAAQFDVKSLNLGSAGVVDLSNASISLVLACGIAYMMARCMIEYAMQPDEVRQWHLAQTDFRLSLFLVQTTLLMLAAGGLNRSVDTVVYVAFGTLILMGGSFLLIFLGTMALMPLRMFFRARQGRISAASSAFEAMAWSEVIVLILVVALLVALGVASLEYELLRSLWTAPPSPIAVAIFVAAAIAVVINLKFQEFWEGKLFARPAPYTMTTLPDGSTGISFHRGKNVQQDESQSSKNGPAAGQPASAAKGHQPCKT